ncbi:uncharacterized protein LOC115718055 [Cannabis sativa]|uniref:uncharacterized protein LOC115718055 n=1 Tax=Cannabis sativa TaxID=3483 RepID=UPI0029C9EA08|nr:uncharacterized protein LOC115718055 [Cannabis sativa]
MHCLSSVQYQVLLNGGLTKAFVPKRGLKQGDPLSPYLFILGAEVLSRLFSRAESEGNLKGYSLSRGGTPISHLMYADDLLIFLEAEKGNVAGALKSLDTYCSWSGQMMNMQKSKIFFSKNCSGVCREEIQSLLGLEEMGREEKFLGNPLFLKGNRSSDFEFILDKISARLEGWRARLLSQAARGMSVFVLPRKIINQIDAVLRRFWWTGQSKEGRFLALKAWDTLCKPKQCGDLGFSAGSRCQFQFDRQVRVDVGDGFQGSLDSCSRLQEFIRENCVWVVGKQSKVKIWHHNWSCGDNLVVDSGAINPLVGNSIGFQDLVVSDEDVWHHEKVISTFNPVTTSNILKVNRESLLDHDSACWKPSPNGNFSIKAAYWSLNSARFEQKDNIFGNPPGVCMFCGHDEGDTVKHFISFCPVTRSLWFASRWCIRLEALQSSNGREVVSWLFNPPFLNAMPQAEAREFTVYGALLYYKLWNLRNEMFHRGVPLQLDKLIRQIGESFVESISLVDGLAEPVGGFSVSGAVHWGSPRCEKVKGFVDCALGKDVGSVAVVFYDNLGNLVGFGAKKVHVNSAFQGELEALAFGTDLAKDLHLGGVDFSSDCQLLVKALIAGSSPFWFLTLSFTELYNALVASDSHVVWISRVLNNAAHSLARWGLSHPCNGLLRFWEVSPHVLTNLFFSA